MPINIPAAIALGNRFFYGAFGVSHPCRAAAILIAPMDEKRGGIVSSVFCAVDVETSGLYMGSRLVGLGAVRFSPAGPIDDYHTLADPMELIQPAATDIHGITDDMVCGCPRPAEAVSSFGDYLGGAVFVAQNARFDVRVIGLELARAGPEPAPVVGALHTILVLDHEA